MAITKEALTYLHELERIDNWTSIPNDDKRIVKLRKLFETKQEMEERAKRNYGSKVKATIQGIEITFNSTRECAEALDFNLNSLRSSMTRNKPLNGILFERVED